MYELSSANAKTVSIYWQLQAGAEVPTDPLLNRNLALVHQIVEANKEAKRSLELHQLLTLMVMK